VGFLQYLGGVNTLESYSAKYLEAWL